MAGGALLTGISVFAHWQGIIAAYQALHAGLTGDLTLFLLQLALLPNLILCATAWSVGAGFSLGEGTLFSPAVADGPALPALPVFAAMPTATGPYSFAVLVLPVLAGALAAWWFLRAGEDHVDDWFSLRIGSRVLGAILSGAVFAVVLGALTGAGATLLVVLARGGLGAGPFAVVGPHPGAMFCWSAVTVAIGAVILTSLYWVFSFLRMGTSGLVAQAHERGVKVIGATAHYVTSDLDEGPIIEQDFRRVDHRMSPAQLAATGAELEAMAFARALRWHVERRVVLRGRRTIVFD